MTEQIRKTKGQSGVRKGTAKHDAGKATARRILESARTLLAQENFTKFTMRNVANRAGVNLRNLQYYFPTRQDLAQALFIVVDERYRVAYARCLEEAENRPLARLKAVLQFNMRDITQRETRQFFVQFWALLGSLDEFRGKFLGGLFSIHIEQLREHIAAVQPELSELDLKCRATLLEGVLEGVMVVLSALPPDDPDTAQLVELTYQQCLAIALGK